MSEPTGRSSDGEPEAVLARQLDRRKLHIHAGMRCATFDNVPLGGMQQWKAF